ncbi:type IV secretion system DNA-binding domain-containing protein [Methylocystis hirsuta]|uniref:Type IV secretion system coupling protein TraD DNA-binding domain-containing protein n=1 Tax=Methylocystis hirsuta TaxID=369798 RepID=A0A3M9XUC1_9HYPH|nr:type IV secretion system DNA-binding domain-containing protein [Methylocystis hirsuta]RNJ51392.1 hypothetical protein D1O30_19110 [Methylocystis hirsuta]
MKNPFSVFRDGHRNAPTTVRQEARKQNGALYRQACALATASRLPSAEAFADRIVADTSEHIRHVLHDIAVQLYRAEGFEPDTIVPPPPIPESIEAARYRDALIAQIAKLSDPSNFTRFENAIQRSFQAITSDMPQIESGPFSISLLDMLPDAGQLIEHIAEPIHAVSASFREQYDKNLCAVSRLPFTKESLASHKLIRPSSHGGTMQAIADAYLKSTPFEILKSARLPFAIPEAQRGEHWHLLGGTGHGKTQTLSHIIMSDLQKSDPPALIIIDSQGQLLPQIQRLALFDPAAPGSLSERLIIVNPEDDMPPALNMFAINNTRIHGYSRIAREIVEGDVLQLFNYIFASLAAELSTQMGTAFAYVSRLMLSIKPAATIHTLLQFLEEDVRRAEQSRFYDNIISLDPTARSFFEKQFYKNTSFTQTRFALARRLYDVVRVPAFERMFASRQNKLSMFEAIQRRSIICVNTSDSMLKDASPLFGRYMIASTMAAVFERVAVPESEWNQAYLIIDEAASYFDENLEKLLRQARKYKLGVLFAHQLMDDLKGAMRAHVASNTSIKMFGGAGYSDAKLLANEFQNTPDFLFSQKKDNRDPLNPRWANWACYIRNMTPRAISINVPFYALRDAPKMSEASYQALLARNRTRYAADPEPTATETPPSTEKPADTPPASPTPSSQRAQPKPSRKHPRRDPDA